jgi:DNA repair protein RadC
MTIQVGEVGRKRERVQYVPVFRVQLVREGSTKTCNKELSSPSAAADIMQDYIGDTDREIFVVAMLDTKNKVIGINTVAVGSLNSTIVHPREVLKPAILANAAGIIVGHNHPSGDLTPSLEDMSVTERLGEACKIVGINLLDHVIIGDGQYLSFKERGFL